MALTETTEYDKIEVVGPFKAVQARKATIIKKDGVEIARSFDRSTFQSDQDVSAEADEIKAICNAVWTDAIKAAYKSHLTSLPASQ